MTDTVNLYYYYPVIGAVVICLVAWSWLIVETYGYKRKNRAVSRKRSKKKHRKRR